MAFLWFEIKILDHKQPRWIPFLSPMSSTLSMTIGQYIQIKHPVWYSSVMAMHHNVVQRHNGTVYQFFCTERQLEFIWNEEDMVFLLPQIEYTSYETIMVLLGDLLPLRRPLRLHPPTQVNHVMKECARSLFLSKDGWLLF